MNDGEDIPRREYYQQVIAGLGPLQKLMLDLDVAVTGVPPERAVSQYHHMPATLENWLEQPGGNPIWYLADAGYSRVVWSTDTGNLFLTYNSTSKAKAKWDKAKPQREAVTNYLMAEYERLLGHPREWRTESRAEHIVNRLLEVRFRDPVPPKPAFDDPDAEIDFYTRNPFMAYTHAVERGRHHPKLFQAVQGSVYEPLYRRELLGESSPRLKALKKGRTPLSDAERKEVERRKACWDDGHPGVWKSRVNGKTYYVCNTQRAAQIKPTLKGAIKAFTFIKSTAWRGGLHQ